MNLIAYLRALVREKTGQDLLEYALLAALIALVAIIGVRATGTSVNGIFNDVSAALEAPGGAPAP